MEVYFLDVGLGSCQIILLGNRRAIVIDSGIQKDHLALQFLQRHGVDEIVSLIITHSHKDHSGGVVSILGHYQDQINQICIIQDHILLRSNFWERICYFIESKIIDQSQITPLIIDDKPRQLWKDGSTSGLKLLSPSYFQSLQAQASNRPNATSAVLEFKHHGKKIVFASDSVIGQWKTIFEKRNKQKTECEILAVPHHGGKVEDEGEDLEWLYEKVISANFAILSVGTHKKPKHPRKKVIDVLRKNGSKVFCTEITSQCHNNPYSLRPGVLRPLNLTGRAFDSRQKTMQRGAIACAGTIFARMDENGVEIDRLPELETAITQLTQHDDGHPMCCA